MRSPDWAPSPADVGARLRARTKDRDGNELGTFTSTTRPTGDQVLDDIDTIVAEINAACGTIPDDIQDNARRLAAVGAACLVEMGYFPEQINSGRSPYPQLKEWYDAGFERLKTAVADLKDDGVINEADTMLPIFDFPVADPCDPNAFPGWMARF